METSFRAEIVARPPDNPTYDAVFAPDSVAAQLSALPVRHGEYGTVKVRATVGGSTWETSVFHTGGKYMLIIKKPVMATEGLSVGETVTVKIEVIAPDTAARE